MKRRTQEKLEQRIKEILATLIQRDLSDPRLGFVTVQSVDLSPELDFARVSVSVLGSPAEHTKSLRCLKSAAGFLQREMGRVLSLRRTPRLVFLLDEQVETAIRLADAIARARAEDEADREPPEPPELPEPDPHQ